MPKDFNTGETLHLSGKDPKKLKPLKLTKSNPIIMPIWESLQVARTGSKGYHQAWTADLNGTIVLELVETRPNSDEWETCVKTAMKVYRGKFTVKGLALAKVKVANFGRERCLRAAYCADELVNQAVPF
jgi:hypothetical protein